ncbi:hypothetical protein [Parvibaculum sp.]|uniref:hypothetical protein n=1 Tax=Parvibaculum sp. TaxID=2024848 RepID=UPI00273185DC|nr:hypothetical protein [Parvibaculum sp.]MDP2148271.1 hypothetical protein [Parvibaculum sp.]
MAEVSAGLPLPVAVASRLIPGLGARRAPAGPPGLSPYDTAGLALAYDLLMPGSAVYDGSDRVERLVNFSSIANCDATQASNSFKPVYEPTGLNGRPCIKADGGGDFMDLGGGALSLTQNIAAWTEIFVGQTTSTAGATVRWGFSTNGNVTRIALGINAGQERILQRRLDTDGQTVTFLGARATGIYVSSRDVNFATGLLRGWDNGAALTPAGSGPSGGNTSNTASTRARLFANLAESPGSPASFRLGARYCWPRLLTDDERNGITQRLGFLWGLTVS